MATYSVFLPEESPWACEKQRKLPFLFEGVLETARMTKALEGLPARNLLFLPDLTAIPLIRPVLAPIQ